MRPQRLLTAIAFAGVAATCLRALIFTPIERNQGVAQKILYIHAPSAWVAFVAFGLVGISSAFFLGLRDARLDQIAESAAEVGLVFTTVVLVTGPLWAKPVWGTLWTWDARLSLTLFLWFLFLSYFVLRGAVEAVALRRRYAAVVGIMGALLVPFIHISVYLFRTMHPRPVFLKPSPPSMPREMTLTLVLSIFSFMFLFLCLLVERYQYGIARDSFESGNDDA
jgi:heme exporter protein C